ncbi:hypothetical protein CDIK_2161 [Cucumispora dikerogammari]|nr:hypothetical protein CDIK_2161 [Cucumispora dikerogammari]
MHHITFIAFVSKKTYCFQSINVPIDVQPDIYSTQYIRGQPKGWLLPGVSFIGSPNYDRLSIDFSIDNKCALNNVVDTTYNDTYSAEQKVYLWRFTKKESKEEIYLASKHRPHKINISEYIDKHPGFCLLIAVPFLDFGAGRLRPGCQHVSICSAFQILSLSDMKKAIGYLRRLFGSRNDGESEFGYRFTTSLIIRKSDGTELPRINSYTNFFQLYFCPGDLNIYTSLAESSWFHF